jgi:hypothetical protein
VSLPGSSLFEKRLEDTGLPARELSNQKCSRKPFTRIAYDSFANQGGEQTTIASHQGWLGFRHRLSMAPVLFEVNFEIPQEFMNP